MNIKTLDNLIMEQANLKETKIKQKGYVRRMEHNAVKQGMASGGNWLVRRTTVFVVQAHSVRFILEACAAIFDGNLSANKY